MKNAISTVCVAASLLLVAACSELAVDTAPLKMANVTDTALKEQALTDFWSSFHDAGYDQVPTVLDELTSSYQENPNDPERSLPLALAHLWAIAESTRLPTKPGAAITDHLVVAEKYFSETLQLTPNDYRVLGWLGTTRQGVGTMNNDQRMVREGYFMTQDGLGLYPAFDGFVIAVGTNRLLRTDPHFQGAVDALWDSVDACAGTHVDRTNPDFGPILEEVAQGQSGPLPICFWTDKAPHVLEGFMLQAGDTFTKAGNTGVAQVFYANAQKSPDYANWAFAPMLEDHLANINARAAGFAAATTLAQEPEMVGNSIGSCTSCHQR